MLDRYSIAKKLLFSNLLYGIPFVILMFLMISAKTEDISFAKKEINGLVYLKAIEPIMQNIISHKLHQESEKSAIVSKIDQFFDQAEATDAELGKKLQMDENSLKKRGRENLQMTKLRKSWESIKTAKTNVDADQSSLVGDIRAVIAHVGDTSNLVLDPDLDSYYVMMLVLNTLPQLQDRLQNLASTIEATFAKDYLSNEDRSQLGGYLALLENLDISNMVSYTGSAIDEDSNFYGTSTSLQENLPAGLKETLDHLVELTSLLRKIVKEDKVTVNIEELQRVLREAQTLSFTYWNVCVNELQQLLETRINRLSWKRFWSILLGLSALSIAAAVAWTIAMRLKSNLAKTINKLTETSSTTFATGTKMTETSRSLSASSSEQAASIQETVATLNEITAMVHRSVDHVQTSASKTAISYKAATEGQDVVNSMREAMLGIQDNVLTMTRQTEQSNKRIESIFQIINDIASKSQVINDIAFQTKLLAFNASVEAARAGEHGRGFSVVAEEVGKLAQMSSAAAREITEILKRGITEVGTIIRDSTQQMNVLVAKDSEKVEAGVAIANRCEEMLKEVVENVNGVNSLMTELSMAAREQANGISSINIAMNEIDKTIHLNSNIAFETMQLSSTLSNQSQRLQGIVHELNQQLMGGRQAPLVEPIAAESAAVPAIEPIEAKKSDLVEKKVA